MIRDGSENTTLAYLAKHQNILAVNSFSDAQTEGRDIRHYANYLSERARAYRETKIDWVRDKSNRLDSLSVDKGLLRQTGIVQRQLAALLKCDMMETEPENDITICIFRLLVADLLKLFQALNQGMINILGHFFEMAKIDAEKAMDIYTTFTKQTDYVVQYLSVARQYEHLTRIQVPKLKHAPVTLRRQLDDYLKDPDFEVNRRQFLLEKENKKKGGKLLEKSPTKSVSPNTAGVPNSTSSQPASQPISDQPTKGPDTNLIDLFDSLDDNQTTMIFNTNPQPVANTSPWGNMPPFQQLQPTGFSPSSNLLPQQTTMGPMPSGFVAPDQIGMFGGQQPQSQQAQTLHPQATAAGFGGFTPQPQMSTYTPSSLGAIPQNTMVSSFPSSTPNLTAPQPAPVQQPMTTGTNPFRQSMMPQQSSATINTGNSPASTNPNRKSTNPFARTATQSTPLQPAPTGTNPFASSQPSNNTTAPSLATQQTGTNPFRQGAFVNHQTGMGWQHGQQPMGGGLDNLETVPVFPRPTQQTPWQS